VYPGWKASPAKHMRMHMIPALLSNKCIFLEQIIVSEKAFGVYQFPHWIGRS